MKILWLDINSSYSHSSVALPAIHAQVEDGSQVHWDVVRGTINEDPGALAVKVADSRPDVIAATFWLFTHQMQIEVLSRAVQLLDEVKVICGGPEFLGNNEEFLRRHGFITAVLRGEGELALPKWIDAVDQKLKWSDIEGLCWLDDAAVYHDNGVARVMDFASLKYPEESQFFKWDRPFVQLETTRGCFNTCAFCVSGGEKPVRQQSLEQVAARLENIYRHGIKDIRVLDRTFNFDVERACSMLDIFSQYEGKLRFHLEIHPALLSETLKDKLTRLPKGLLHLEAGIQSLDRNVLELSGRKGSQSASLDGLRYLSSLDNVETHADLIAGLPGYTLDMVCKDVRTLAQIGVDELQLESLKVLPGTMMRKDADILSLKYSPLPPYEVLRTPAMPAADIKTAMHISRMLDFYYNCKAWQSVTRKLIVDCPGFIMNFTEHLKQMMVLDSPLSLERRGVILYEYCLENHHTMASDISMAWIEAGCSLKKKPAEGVLRIKNLEKYLSSLNAEISIEYGEADASHRYFALETVEGTTIFGFDSQEHHPEPCLKAKLM